MLTKRIIPCLDVHDGRVVKEMSFMELSDAGGPVELGAGEILLTGMDVDGHQSGYDLELTRAVSEMMPVPVIASGGAGQLDRLFGAFTGGQAEAVLVASIFDFGVFSIGAAKGYLAGKGVPMRCL